MVGGGWGRGASTAAYVPPDWDDVVFKKKKGKKTAANETRRKAAGEGLVAGEKSLVGGATGPPVCEAASCATPAQMFT